MSWVKKTLSSTIGRKLLMSLTGIFLIIFLVVHLIGNLQLFKDDGGYAFNAYAKFMTTNTLIVLSSYVLYFTIIAHVVISAALTVFNRKARGGEGYMVTKSSYNSPWTSRNMGILGTIVLIFIVIHLSNFWYHMKFGETPMVKYEKTINGDINISQSYAVENFSKDLLKQDMVYKDLYRMVAEAFKQEWLVILYVLAMAGLAFHLAHGFQSAFQTLGINHKKYTPFIEKLGLAFSVIVPALFASMPIIFYFKG
jgi:succinate dehydrogenase / fumarate reductase, cytochrome b subunit